MKMKMIIALAAAVLALLLLAGCASKNDFLAVNVFTGTDGLTMQFMTNAPPAQVYENGEFEIGIIARNQGIHNIANGFIVATIEKDYMQFAEGDGRVPIQINGKSVYNTQGDEAYQMFKMNAKKLENQSRVHETNVAVTACYDYQTWATPTVCVDTDIYNMNTEKKPCNIQDVEMTDQGSPVAVTKVEVKMLPAGDVIKPTFKIYIQNKGIGHVIDKNRISNVCGSEGLDYRDWNTVYVRAFLANTELSCKPTPMRLDQQENYVVCSLDAGLQKTAVAYSTLLNIFLDYGYTSTISSKVAMVGQPVSGLSRTITPIVMPTPM